jgi:zinc protease
MDTKTLYTTPPPDEPEKSLRLPDPAVHVLSNNLKVTLVVHPRSPMVQMRWMLPGGGSRLDTPELSGIASTTARLLTASTPTRDSFQIAAEAEGYGGNIGASANHDYVTIHAACLGHHLPAMLHLVKEVIQNPTYPAEEVEIDRKNTLQRLQLQRSQPSFLAHERFAKELFGDHPYACISPSEEAVRNWQPADLQAFHAHHYKPAGASLVMVGNFDIAEMLQMLEEAFGDWQGSPGQISVPDPLPSVEHKEVFVERPGSVQSYIRMGNLCPTRTHPDFTPLNVGVMILGGGASSRLFLTVREKYGYAYSVGCNIETYQTVAQFVAEAQTSTQNTDDATRQITAEITRMNETLVPEEELQAIKNNLIGRFAMGWITLGGVADMIARLEPFGLPFDYWRTYPERLHAVSSESIREVFNRYLDPSRLVSVTVG